MNTTTKETIFVVIILLLSFSPLLGTFVSGHWNEGIPAYSPTYLDGLIIASGVFVAFLSATVLSRAKDIDRMDFLFVRLSLFTFIAAMFWQVTQLMEGFFMNNAQLGLLSASLTLCGFTTWRIMHTLYRESHS